MKIYFLLAIRNLRRNLRRTLLTISGMAVGFAVLLWLQCILKGVNAQIVDEVVSTQVGHLQVWRTEYLEDPLINFTFAPDMTKLRAILPPGTVSTERVFLPALISSGENSVPIQLIGIDPKREAEVTNVRETKVDGEYLSEIDDPDCKEREAYVGKALAGLLKVGIGDKIVLLAQAADGTLGNELLRVRGMFDTGSRGFDRSVAYSTMGCVRKIGVIQGDHEITIRLARGSAMDKFRKSLESRIGEVGPQLKVTTWREAVPPLAGMVMFNDATLILVSLVLFGVTTFGVVNTLLMSVFERTREFGVMLALGVTPKGVCVLILIEAAMIGILAAVVGTLLGSAMVAYHGHVGFDLKPFLGEELMVNQFKLSTVFFPIFSFDQFFGLVGATILFAILAGLFPAIQAAKMDVIEAIRHR
jgi:ABC-type lipoprotein release transport system permease subunit